MNLQNLRFTQVNKNNRYTYNQPSQRKGFHAVKVGQNLAGNESSIHPSSQISYDQEIMVNEEFVTISASSSRKSNI